jgi:predicted transcriptional regulator
MPKWAANALDSDLTHLEEAVSVRMAATMGELVTCAVGETVKAAFARDNSDGLDYLPVLDTDMIVGVLVRQKSIQLPERPVREAMESLHSKMLVSAVDPLLPVLELLDDTLGFRLVVQSGEVRGILTLSDLQKLPVRSLLFARITHAELLLAEAIRSRTGNDPQRWLNTLNEGRRVKVQAKWDELKKSKAELDRLECTEFADKRDALVELGGLVGWSKTKLTETLGSVERLRNEVAHASEYASSPDEAKKTVRLTRELGKLIADLQHETGRGTVPQG